MKKLLFWILTCLWIWLSFCSADWIYQKVSNWDTIVSVVNWDIRFSFKKLDTSKTYFYWNNSSDVSIDIGNWSFTYIPCTENYISNLTWVFANLWFRYACHNSWDWKLESYNWYIQWPCWNWFHILTDYSEFSTFVSSLSSFSSSYPKTFLNNCSNKSSSACRLFLWKRTYFSSDFSYDYIDISYTDNSISTWTRNNWMQPVLCISDNYLPPDPSWSTYVWWWDISYNQISSSCSSTSPSWITIYTWTFTDTAYTYHKLFNLTSNSVICFSWNIVGGNASFSLGFTTLSSNSFSFSYTYPSVNYWNWFCFSKRSNYPDSTYFIIRSNYTSIFEYFVLQDSFCGGSSSCPSSLINVLYNNWNSTSSITCDWTQSIAIEGLSTITNTNTFTPYFNINYRDEDNQLLTESYSKDILYLKNWLFKKTYTWNNERILSYNWSESNFFTWFVPTFNITWGIEDVSESWNIFNNFAENSVKLTLSNIPSYIQYVIIFMLLLFILWFIRRFKRR